MRLQGLVKCHFNFKMKKLEFHVTANIRICLFYPSDRWVCDWMYLRGLFIHQLAQPQPFDREMSTKKYKPRQNFVF